MSERSEIECDGGPYCQAPEHIHGCFAEGRTWMTGPKEVARLRTQLAGAVDALAKLAEIHHGTITPSRLHDPHNRDWTECECKSCRLAQAFWGQ